MAGSDRKSLIGVWYMRGIGASRAVRLVCVGLSAAAMLAGSACAGTGNAGTSDQKAVLAKKGDAGRLQQVKPRPAPPSLAVAPADKASGVATGTDIAVKSSGQVAEVSLTGPGGKAVPGELVDPTTWRPAAQLAYGAAYTLAVKATAGSAVTTATSSFRTMAQPPAGKLTGIGAYFSEGETVGVGSVLVLEFGRGVPVAQRAAVESRLSVVSNPPTEGSWSWIAPDQVHYRPRAYWAAGTKVFVRAALGGAPMGGGRYGKRDRSAHLTIGSAVISKVNNATKTMTVYKDGKVIRTIPVSLGRASMPTSAGVHLVMEKEALAEFDSSTFGLPNDKPGGYKEKVPWAVRFTWGGEFVHSAWWSEWAQGHRNVSHGCVNVSTKNAHWFFDLAKKGDVVEVIGTERKVKPGDGFTDWNVPWATYRAGSALH
jgi:lipoprotein-anchoring transpeptidase ErfK/SrfK